MTMMDPKAQAKRLLARWTDRADLFGIEAMGYALWPRQVEALRAISESPRVCVRSGHKVGKSTIDIVAAAWWACTRHRARVIMTAPTARQVRMVLWKELKRAHRMSRAPLGGTLHATPSTGWQFNDGREVVGFTADDNDNFSGISGPNILWIADEASGISEEIFEAIEGNAAAGVRILMTGNPTQTVGTFFESFGLKSQFWNQIHISSREAAEQNIPGLATRAWCDEHLAMWGEDSPLYQIKVLGNFALQSSDAVVPLSLVLAANERWGDTRGDGPLVLGVDVARFGDDDSIISPRRGRKVYAMRAHHGLDTVAIAGEVRSVALELRKNNETVTVNVDTCGIGGGVADVLRSYALDWLDIVDVNSAETSDDEDLFPNLRSQLCFAVADFLKDGGALPQDSALDGELIAARYSIDPRGRRKVESKDDIKKRLPGGRSPDRADAVALSIYRRPNFDTGGKAPLPQAGDSYESRRVGLG